MGTAFPTVCAAVRLRTGACIRACRVSPLGVRGDSRPSRRSTARKVPPADNTNRALGLRRQLLWLFAHTTRDGAWWDDRITVYAPLNRGGDGRTPFLAPLSASILETRTFSVGPRARATLSLELREAVARDVDYAWLLLSMYGSDHFNALWVDMRRRRVAVFEPHGADLQDPSQPRSIRGYYVSSTHAAAMTTLVRGSLRDAGLAGWAVDVPRDIQPGVWGQSWLSAPTCVAWAVWCLVGATRCGSASAFVASVTAAHEDGTLDAMFGDALENMVSASGAG